MCGGGRKYHGPQSQTRKKNGGRGPHTYSRHPREAMGGHRSPCCAEGAPGHRPPPPVKGQARVPLPHLCCFLSLLFGQKRLQLVAGHLRLVPNIAVALQGHLREERRWGRVVSPPQPFLPTEASSGLEEGQSPPLPQESPLLGGLMWTDGHS